VKYLSVCSGIEAASVAWTRWSPIAFAEIEKFPSAVLAHHYPNVPNWGDINDYRSWPEATPDVLVGGTPCQSFSVAGLRRGLADPRGNLTLDYLGIADRYRPRWVVWENVPGILSEDNGRTFGTFLGGLAELGYGFAYRVLDAQYFRLAQRRKRVFVVGHLGNWRRAAAVLLERQCLRGDPAPSREEGPSIATGTLSRAVGRVGGGDDPGANKGTALIVTGPDESEISHAVSARDAKGPDSLLAQATLIAFDTTQITSDENRCNPQPGDPSHPLARTGHPPAVAFAELADQVAANQARTYTREGTHNFRMSNVAMHGAAVRRLTPLECERLQGFPDNYTMITKKTKDTPRYKALGNSMAVPVMRWIGQRIDLVEGIE